MSFIALSNRNIRIVFGYKPTFLFHLRFLFLLRLLLEVAGASVVGCGAGTFAGDDKGAFVVLMVVVVVVVVVAVVVVVTVGAIKNSYSSHSAAITCSTCSFECELKKAMLVMD